MTDLALAGKRITVLGAGRTGQATARFLIEQQAKVLVSDRSPIPSPIRQQLADLGISYEEGIHSARSLEADGIIPSPGVPYDTPVLQQARTRGISIWSELELAYYFCKSQKIIAVTGTVGKTTTTHLISKLLQAHGHPTVVAGNIGQPFIALLPEIDPATIVVLEVSSFQLEHVSTFKPHIGVFTRFAPHHLDRHGSLERYFAMKCRLFAQQNEKDVLVAHRDIALPHSIRSQITRFSKEDLRDLLPDIHAHQREDLAGALQAARRIDSEITLSQLDIQRALRLPHRLELVVDVRGIRFYNDSKATSVAATLAALSTFHEPLVLILGGYDEGGDPTDLAQAIQAQEVRAVLLLGQTRQRWARVLTAHGYRRVRMVENVQEAIQETVRLGPRVCLFSPAAPSFDQFKNYEERGEHFKRLVLSYLS